MSIVVAKVLGFSAVPPGPAVRDHCIVVVTRAGSVHNICSEAS